MRFLVVVLFIVAMSGTSFGYGSLVSGCPASKEVDLSFNWMSGGSTGTNTVSTDLDYRVVGLYAVSTNQPLKMRATSDANGQVKVAFTVSSTVISGVSCVASAEPNVGYIQGLVGIFCAGLLWSAIILGMRS